MSRYVQNPAILQQKLDDEGVLYDEESDRVHQMNETAWLVWEACVRPATADDVADRFADRYDVARDRALEDANRVLGEMVTMNLLIPDSGDR